jgi:PAS domain S-box-containing protein
MTAILNPPKIGSTLLIVDGDDGTRDHLRQLFEDHGHAVVTAADAPSALRLLHREQCDLIMLDVEMPGISGLALCRLLRAQTATRRLPVIMFSAHDDDEHKVKAFAAGADDYIVKPGTPGELLSRVSAQLENAERERALMGSNRELSFLADLGRGLLCALEPAQVVRRVAGATYEGANVTLCGAAIRTDEGRLAVCVFDREGSAEGAAMVHLDRLGAWLASPGSAVSVLLTDKRRFLLRDKTHGVEYVAPLRFGGKAVGALIAAFDIREACGETECRLVEAAAQMGAMAAHISSLYEAARRSSENLAKEVERRTAEAERQRRFTEAIIDSLPVSLHAVDREYRIAAWNRNRELGGQGIPRNAVLGRNIFEVLTKQPRELLESEFERVFTTGQIEHIELETTTPTGETKHWLISKVPMRIEGDEVSHVITVGEDITARVQANRAVARTEKLAAVGRLAAGVVHEINNPLATISACAEALETRLDEGALDADDLREYLSLIRSEAFRCKTITNGLLDFSRTRAGRHAPVNVAYLLASVARLITHQRRGEKIKIGIEATDSAALVSGDEGQLQQAVIVLAENAIDAMPEGGTLTLGMRREAGRIIIEVKDTGVGIAPEHMSKIFDPFFTTKEVGRGTGLGLAVCYGIVTEHGGRISVDSALGRGTSFAISLPALADNEESSKSEVQGSNPQNPGTGFEL